MLHCTRHDSIYYDGVLVAVGPFLVALSLKGIPQSRVQLEQTTDCKVCVFEGTCTGHVRHTVPEALLIALA